MTDLVGLYVDTSRRPEEYDLYDYPLWWLRSIQKLPTFSSGSVYRVSTPKTRYHRRHYYSWLKHIEVKQGNWIFITLTLRRDLMPLFVAWLLIGVFISLFLNRMRNFFRRRGRTITYFWTVEPHSDGFPHVHLLVSFPFIPLEQIIKWWRDKTGIPLSSSEGVDVKFIGNNTQQVKQYLVKYLVKSHSKLFSFTSERISASSTHFRVLVRLSTLLIWLYSVRLYGSSRDFFKATRSFETCFVFLGFTFLLALYERRYAPLGIDFSEFLLGMYYTETLDLHSDEFFDTFYPDLDF